MVMGLQVGNNLISVQNLVPSSQSRESFFIASSTTAQKVKNLMHNLVFIGFVPALGTVLFATVYSVSPVLICVSLAIILIGFRKIASVMIRYVTYPSTLIYPLQFASRIPFFPFKNELTYFLQGIKKEEKKSQELCQQKGCVLEKILIQKPGCTYKGLMIGHQNTINNGKWLVFSFGNMELLEFRINDIFRVASGYGCNALMINSPGAGEGAKGFPTRYQCSAGYLGGIEYLEKVKQATHIALMGYSMGGAVVLESALKHPFDVFRRHYLVVSDRTFSRLSDTASKMAEMITELFFPIKVSNFMSWVVSLIFQLTDVELDSLKGSERLTELGIKHLIIQHDDSCENSSDEVIPDCVGLAKNLKKSINQKFLLSPFIQHTRELPLAIRQNLDDNIRAFFQEN